MNRRLLFSEEVTAKGRVLAYGGNVTSTATPGIYRVNGETGGRYLVSLVRDHAAPDVVCGATCTCAHARKVDPPRCSHIVAALLVERDGILTAVDEVGDGPADPFEGIA